jgi:hypothetical protein
LDRQRNDRLGRPLLQWGLSRFEHRRQILRGCAGRDTYTNTNRDSDGDAYIDIFTDGETYARSARSPYPGTAPVKMLISLELQPVLYPRPQLLDASL